MSQSRGKKPGHTVSCVCTTEPNLRKRSDSLVNSIQVREKIRRISSLKATNISCDTLKITPSLQKSDFCDSNNTSPQPPLQATLSTQAGVWGGKGRDRSLCLRSQKTSNWHFLPPAYPEVDRCCRRVPEQSVKEAEGNL